MAEHLTVTVDAAARADTERAEEAARAHVSAASSAGGKATVASHGQQMANGGRATMAGPHAHDIHSAGGRATMSGVHAARISSAGGKAVGKTNGKATMSGVHAARISSAGGKAGLGKIRKKPNQTAKQQADAARKRKERAAKRA